ncbi:MAG TPA: hypothetical protein VM802_06495 [Chitinophaga sp.]|uniref:hypothetical protein n=1 Tax=Chitinophaga sp. TaxID=1869181 RepID=UPI002C8FA038|nr:hypothetical protein [Chitinophaga sp.]HVI44497.1 hypothetical protein [Chitinophaga sp.]
MYNFNQGQEGISIQPYLTQYKKYNILWLIYALLLPVAFFVDVPVKYKYIFYSILGISILWFIFDYFFKARISIIFNHHQKTIYKKYPFLFRHKLLAFEEACITTVDIPEGICYAVACKNNRYGKYYPISDYFSDNRKGRAEQEQFEKEILGVIEDLLRIPA